MKKIFTSVILSLCFLLITIGAYAQPPNNDCTGAIAITTEPYGTVCATNIAANTTGATQSTAPPSCAPTSSNDDIFYSFTATNTTQILRFSGMVATSGTATTLGYAISTGACGTLTEISCNLGFGTSGSGTVSIGGLTVGTSYILTLFTGGASNSATFNFCLQDNAPPPPNDDCAGAISLTQNATCMNTAGTTLGATQSMAAAPCSGNPDDDVWFSFVATTTDASIALSSVVAINGTSTDTYYQVLSGSCGSLTSLVCTDPLTGNVGGLTAGETYYIRVYTFGATNTISFNICVFDIAAAPTGCPTLTAPAANATVNNMPLITFNSITNATSYDIFLDQNNPPTTLFATVTNATSFQVTTPLAPGTYFFYVRASNSLGTSPTVCTPRSFTVVAPPANSDCGSATPITPEANNTTCTAAIAANTTGSFPSPTAETNCVTTSDNDNIFYTFTATGTSQVLIFSNMVATQGTATTLGYRVYSGACGSLTELISCSTGFGSAGAGQTNIAGLTIGTSYTLQLFTGSTSNFATFNFCLQDPLVPPANDDCGGAINITTQPAGPTCATNIAATTTGATTSSVTETSCSSTSDNDDIFYTFTATGTTQILRFSGMVATFGTATTLGYRVYSGTCAGLTQLASCDIAFGSAGAGQTIISGLTVGTVYTLQLFTGGTGNTANFNFCLQDNAAPPPNDDCGTAIAVTTQAFSTTCTASTAASTTGANSSNITETSCVTSTIDNDDIFYTFTATATTQVLRFSGLTATFGTTTTLGYHIFTGTCGSLTQLTSCSNSFGSAGAGSTNITGLTVGTSYTLRLFTGSSDNSGTFNFCIQDALLPPANDECAGAIAMPVTPSGTACNFTAVNTGGATQSTVTGQANACTSTGIDDDVFYTFTSTIAGTYTFSYNSLVAITGTASTVGMNVYTGTCGSLTEVTSACSSGFGSAGSGSRTVALAAGVNYTLRLSVGSNPNSGTFNFCITAPSPPPVNDECASAISITTQPFSPTCATTTAANTTGATQSLITETACVTTNDNDDIFYSFTATSTSQILRFSNMVATSGTATALGYQIFSACTAASQLPSCNASFGSGGSGTTIINGLTIGTLYNIRLFTGGTANSATFDFCIQDNIAPPPNDECAGAITITTQPFTNTTCASSTSASTSGATPSAITETSCVTTSDNDDIFYSFTATSTTQVLRFSNMVATVNTATTLGYQIFTGACPGTQLTSCSAGFGSGGSGNTIITGLTVGTTYTLRLFTGGSDNSATFNFCIQDPSPPPANDNCAGAIAITTQPFSAPCSSTTSANTSGATASAVTETTCTTSNDDDDIFYSFTATGTSQVLRFSNMVATTGIATTLGFHVFTACGSGTSLASCSVSFGSAGSGNFTITGLTIGTNYFLQLFTGTTGGTATFDFCVQDLAPVPPNDECATAIAITTQASGANCATPTTANTNGATQSTITETSCVTSNDNDDIFYSFTATNATQTLNFSNLVAGTGTTTQIGYQVFPSCGGVQLTSCSTGFGTAGSGTTAITGLTVGTNYIIRLFTGGTANSGTFNFCIQDPIPPPPNDNCPGAISLNGSAVINGTTVSATQSMPPEPCNGFTPTAALDVFFSFTATQNGTATILVDGDPGFDAVVRAYSGTCASLTLIDCADATFSGDLETLVLPGLVQGQTYFIKVNAFGGTTTGTFTIQAVGAALPITVEYVKGNKKNTGNLIEWKVNCNNSPTATMVLERSSDGRNFESITTITATAVRCLQPFSFVDASPRSGTNYYRLRSTDADGKTTYSTIIAILNSNTGLEIVNLMPNPAKGAAVLNISSATATSMDIIVRDPTGRLVQRKTVMLVAGSNTIPMNFTGLTPGMYYITGTSTSEKRTVKFIKE
ncbi:MAG: T9SS type A sorting domain-containing protein [Ferruginibacter sp.]